MDKTVSFGTKDVPMGGGVPPNSPTFNDDQKWDMVI